jgi:carbamate kinase
MSKVAIDKPILLIALGGNALIKKGQQGTIEEQFENLSLPVKQIARLSKDYRIIITHGNGPQVGNLLLQQECCQDMPKLPLEILVAQTEGQIGYMIESSLDEALMEIGIPYRPLISLITYVVVDKDDPAFKNPTKPIGPVYPEDVVRSLPYSTVKTAKGCRRVVASPRPVTIIEKREIKTLIDMDFIIICCGGGGIPVIRKGRSFNGVDAVVDKDLASAQLAREVGVDIFLIATDETGVYLNYGTENKKLLDSITPEEAMDYHQAGQFPKGTMGPKVEAAVKFVQHTGKRAVITAINRIEKAVVNKAGTEIIPG